MLFTKNIVDWYTEREILRGGVKEGILVIFKFLL